MSNDNQNKSTFEPYELTAYALGELEPEAAARIEAALKQDPSLQAELDGLLAFTDTMHKELSAGAEVELTSEQLRSLRGQTRSSSSADVAGGSWWQRFAAWMSLPSMAAPVGAFAVLLLVAASVYVLQVRHPELAWQIGVSRPGEVPPNDAQRIESKGNDLTETRFQHPIPETVRTQDRQNIQRVLDSDATKGVLTEKDTGQQHDKALREKVQETGLLKAYESQRSAGGSLAEVAEAEAPPQDPLSARTAGGEVVAGRMQQQQVASDATQVHSAANRESNRRKAEPVVVQELVQPQRSAKPAIRGQQIADAANPAAPKLKRMDIGGVIPSKPSVAPAMQLGAGVPSGDAMRIQPPQPMPPGWPEGPQLNREGYDFIQENPFIRVTTDPLSTFSIDVDTAAYANVRRFLNQGQLPPVSAVRIEELLNYFSYDYPQPERKEPFAVHVETGPAPWAVRNRLVRIGIQGRAIDWQARPAANFVFLLDVSGSMNSPNKLPLVKKALSMLVENLDARDRVAVVVYAGASGLALPATPGNQSWDILKALDNLQAGGSTNGGQGIELAYKIAQEHFVEGGINRVILATDGDFNVGTTDRGSLIRLIEDKAKSGVFLSVLGFGSGNLQDSTMEQLADKGNGNYAYIDNVLEARKVLVEQAGGTLMTIAKDVKIQVEFNPAEVEGYRLIGYENRKLAHQDFNDDTKDAGEIGAGHNVTALYEIVPVGSGMKLPGVDPLKYQKPEAPSAPATKKGELLTVKLRYKAPSGSTSKLLEYAVTDSGRGLSATSDDFRFAAGVALFGSVLRQSKLVGDAGYAEVLDLVTPTVGQDPYRKEFLSLVERAKMLSTK